MSHHLKYKLKKVLLKSPPFSLGITAVAHYFPILYTSYFSLQVGRGGRTIEVNGHAEVVSPANWLAEVTALVDIMDVDLSCFRILY